MSNKILLILWGESYRSGLHMTRTRGTQNYIERQLFASQSHIDFINHIKHTHNVETDVVIKSYKLNEEDDNKLIKFYKDKANLINHMLHDNLFSSESLFLNDMYNDTCELIANNCYSHVLYIRIDIYLKKYFTKNITFDEKIKFAFIDSCMLIEKSNNEKIKNICQQIVIYPKSFFYVIQRKIIYNATHEICNHLIQNNVSENDIVFLVNTLHICSTDMGWNPLFVQVGRNYNALYNNKLLHQYTIEYIFDNESKLLLLDKDKTVNYWNHYILNEEAAENLEICKIVI
jgi:hypothetical protein